jgi:trans-2,3-dihydro-3-hydroxyanthranilate isomerase
VRGSLQVWAGGTDRPHRHMHIRAGQAIALALRHSGRYPNLEVSRPNEVTNRTGAEPGSGRSRRRGTRYVAMRGPMQLDLYTLDVFTDRRYAGNPLAVVLGADVLGADRMQAIAREMNLAETVFVLAPTKPSHSARVRIFTPAAELPFAGHPTIGTAVLLAELRSPRPGGSHDAIVVLEQKLADVRVGVRIRPDLAPFAEFDAPMKPEEGVGLPSLERMAGALGLIPSEIGFENHKPTRFSAGNTFAFVPVATLEAIRKARVEAALWQQTFSPQRLLGVCLYTRQVEHVTNAFHSRVFAPDFGITEDPATGSALVAFAGVVQKFDALPDGMHRRVVEQGFEMGRPSLLNLSMEVEQGRLEAVRIGGHAVRVVEGKITV